MSSLTPTNSAIVASYVERTPGSAALHTRARGVLPSGIAHDSRRTEPYPIYVGRAEGPRKWDVDGRELVDFYGGHGALILGHSHPAVVEGVRRQVGLGTHPAACHELEVEWAALVQEMVPCAERVRFTASGTEATHMAVRLARAHTGRPRIMRFQRHFHGWHDHMAFGVDGHFDGSPSPGVLPEVAAEVVLLPPGDLDAVERAFERDDGIAAVILEPTGASTGVVPLGPSFLRGLREATRRHGALLIFDEVVTGFRVAPGGAQEAWGVAPDLCTLAKVLAGGLPGGAVAGRKDVIDWLDFDVSAARRREKVPHQGTYNANPLSAAAGVAALRLVRDTDVCTRANAAAAELRGALNRVLAEEGVPWAVYGEHSVLHFFTNPRGLDVDPLRWDANRQPPEVFAADGRKAMLQKLYLALVVHGVDPKGSRGAIVSAVHGPAEIEQAAEAWRKALRMLKDEGELRH
jgi:glutamate-1-semialdehyde 2,1-aminomutase